MSSSIKNILLVTPGFPIDESDSTCIPALQDFVMGLRQHRPNLKITVISLHYPREQKAYSWNGCKVYALGANNCKFPKRYFYWKRLRNLIHKLHSENQYDIVHSFWFDEVTYVLKNISANLSVPIYCTFMGQDAIGSNRYSKRIKLPEAHLVAISTHQKKNVIDSLGITPAHVVPWGVTLQTQNNLDQKDIDLINIGWFNEIKNQFEAIEILAEIKKTKPTIKMVFVGEGALLDQCKLSVREAGLEDNVIFTGLIARDQLFDLMTRSKILLHSSSYESFGMVFAESILSKMMIVSKKVGIAEEQKWWKIYNSKNEAVRSIIELLDNPVSPDDESLKQFSIERTLESYMKIWRTKKGRT